jgi:DNA helicase-2/ATP-dependent DNA helicase PcrA
VYQAYQQRLAETNNLDFDDLIMKTVQLFERCPEVLEKHQRRLKHVLVDEYQDTSAAQFKLIGMLSGRSDSVFVVGDDDQSIYSWRGADLRNILQFERDFPGAAVIKLEQNYRSTQYILDAANGVIAKNMKRIDKKLWIDKLGGNKITLLHCSDNRAEAEAIASAIATGASRNGILYKDCAVLYRTNHQSKALESAFVNFGIPYRLIGGTKLYQRKEIKDIIAYLKTLANPMDDISCMRMLNVPKRGLGAVASKKIAAYARDLNISFSDAIFDIDSIGGSQKALKAFVALLDDLMQFASSHTVPELVDEILLKTSFIEKLPEEYPDDYQKRFENIQAFIDKAAIFDSNSEDRSLAAFLEEVALVADIDNYDSSSDSVSLMTLHSAKGLEFPSVFLYGMTEGYMPFRRDNSIDKEKTEEERRLFYVGVTRAMSRLTMSYSASCLLPNGKPAGGPSSFIREIPQEVFERKVAPAIAPRAAKEQAVFPSPKYELSYKCGDRVRQIKYGEGVVEKITPSGADYEVTISFKYNGVKKLIAKFADIKKVDA